MSEPLNNIVAALAKALPLLEAAKKTAENPAFKRGDKASKYANITSIIDALKPLMDYGLWYRQQTHECSDGVKIETIYIHSSGQELSAGTIFMPASKKDAQGFGSALTYARRYSLQAAFGLATEDDDGNAAVTTLGAATNDQSAIIDDAQFAELMTLLEQSGSDLVKFCTYYKVDAVKHLPVTKFAHARANALDKLSKRKAA